jgi:hypothetical protein
MCDYSLINVATRPAKVGDKLVTTLFDGTITRGFAAVEDPHVAVCLLPGTEIAFADDIEFEGGLGFLKVWTHEKRAGERMARFRQVDKDKPHVHHDAIELTTSCGSAGFVKGNTPRCCNCRISIWQTRTVPPNRRRSRSRSDRQPGRLTPCVKRCSRDGGPVRRHGA